MWSSSRIKLNVLADWCRSLASATHAGIPLMRALQSNAKKGSGEVRVISQELLDHLKAGEDLDGALRKMSSRFPPLLVAMGHVAASSGQLPEVLKELERFFRFQLKLSRDFKSKMIWPVLQFVVAILIIAGMLWIVGLIGGGNKERTFDPLGLGLVGTYGATVWLVSWGALILALYLGYHLLRKTFGGTRWLDETLLKLPMIGEALRTLALTRLTFAMRITFDTSLYSWQAMELSLDATANDAFRAVKPTLTADLRDGEDLYTALRHHAIFPDDFMEAIHAAVESGTVPESMERLSEEYRDRAEIAMSILVTAANWLIWSIVATIIIVFIFAVFLSYLRLIQDALNQI